MKVFNTHTLTFALEINKNWCSTYVLQKFWLYMLIVEDNCEDQLESRWLLFQLRQITSKSKLFSIQGASHILVRWLFMKRNLIYDETCGFKGLADQIPPPQHYDPLEYCIIAYFFLQKIQWLYFKKVFLWKILAYKNIE